MSRRTYICRYTDHCEPVVCSEIRMIDYREKVVCISILWEGEGRDSLRAMLKKKKHYKTVLKKTHRIHHNFWPIITVNWLNRSVCSLTVRKFTSMVFLLSFLHRNVTSESIIKKIITKKRVWVLKKREKNNVIRRALHQQLNFRYVCMHVCTLYFGDNVLIIKLQGTLLVWIASVVTWIYLFILFLYII